MSKCKIIQLVYSICSGKPLDENAEIHKNGFKNLVRSVKDAIRPDNYVLSVTVLPNVNTSLFYDVQAIIPHVDYVTLAAYDFQTWERNNYEGKITSLHKYLKSFENLK